MLAGVSTFDKFIVLEVISLHLIIVCQIMTNVSRSQIAELWSCNSVFLSNLLSHIHNSTKVQHFWNYMCSFLSQELDVAWKQPGNYLQLFEAMEMQFKKLSQANTSGVGLFKNNYQPNNTRGCRCCRRM